FCFSNDTATTDIYTLSLTTLFRSRRIHSDIMKVDEFEQYDMVVANFFLNVFDEDMMVKVLEHLIRLGKADARVVVGDNHSGIGLDRKSTRLNSSHVKISYAVFCLK